MDDILPVLERTTLFDGVARREIAALCRAFGCRRAYYDKGGVILKRGGEVGSAGIVLSGSVRAERNSADGTLHVVARHGAGALFGDVLNVSRARTSPVDIVAAEDTEVLFVPLAALMGSESPGLGAAQTRVRLNLLAELSEKYWAQAERLALLRLPTLRAKLARLLLTARREQGGGTVTLSGTRETLAAELGVNRSALSRELGRMRREGLLDARRGRFTLLDPAALEKIAGEALAIRADSRYNP